MQAAKISKVKIAIIGAGLVGGATALAIANCLPNVSIVIVDLERKKAEAQVLDLSHATALYGSQNFSTGSYTDAIDADIIIITAGAGVKPGQTRLDLVGTNALIIKNILQQVEQATQDRLNDLKNPIYIVASNPCDILAHVVQKYIKAFSITEKSKVISTGTSLDTARLRAILANILNISPVLICADVLGEHGKSAFIHWSAATIDKIPIEHFSGKLSSDFGGDWQQKILALVLGSAEQIKLGKSATSYGIASAIAKIVQAIVHDANLILPVGIVHNLESTDEVCISLPVLLNASGASLITYPKFNSSEKLAMQISAKTLKDTASSAFDALEA